MSSAQFKGTTIFKISRKENVENNRDIEDVQEDENGCDDPINILCIIHKNGKTGSAYYSFQEKLVSF